MGMTKVWSQQTALVLYVMQHTFSSEFGLLHLGVEREVDSEETVFVAGDGFGFMSLGDAMKLVDDGIIPAPNTEEDVKKRSKLNADSVLPNGLIVLLGPKFLEKGLVYSIQRK